MVDVVKSDQGTGKVQGLLKEDVVQVNCDDHPDTLSSHVIAQDHCQDPVEFVVVVFIPLAGGARSEFSCKMQPLYLHP